jgi:6-phosphogluconolactonase
MQPPFHQFASKNELADTLAGRICAELSQAIEQRGEAILAVSGGSTPALLFTALCASDIEWAKVKIIPVDDRWVEEGHEASNAGMIRRMLMVDRAANAHLISLKLDTASPFTAVDQLNSHLQEHLGEIDVVVLGMGSDGHTASFFTGANNLHQVLDSSNPMLCAATSPPNAPYSRMTLTLPVILRARHCFLHFEGAGKLQVFENASRPGPVEELPIRCVLNSPGRDLMVFYAE